MAMAATSFDPAIASSLVAGTDYYAVTGTNSRRYVLTIGVGDMSTVITTGTGKVSWVNKYGAIVVTKVAAALKTASSAGTVTIDINEAGTTIMAATKLTIDATETDSLTSAANAVISDSAIADNAIMSIDIDNAGSSADAVGLTVYITFYVTTLPSASMP